MTPEQKNDLTKYIRAGSNGDDITEDQKVTWERYVERAIVMLNLDFDPQNPLEILYDLDRDMQDRIIDQVELDLA